MTLDTWKMKIDTLVLTFCGRCASRQDFFVCQEADKAPDTNILFELQPAGESGDPSASWITFEKRRKCHISLNMPQINLEQETDPT